jgi:transcription initiation factor TFIID subunit 1
MDVDEDDTLGSAFGLGSVLAEVGVDEAALNAFLERTEGKNSRALEAAIQQGDEKYMDDVSDGELPEENAEDRAARAREQAAIKANEERWARRAAAELAGTGPTEKEKRRRRQAERAAAEKDVVRTVWPEFRQGTVLKMSEVFYETPAARAEVVAGLMKKKRRLLDGLPRETCELTRVSPADPSHGQCRAEEGAAADNELPPAQPSSIASAQPNRSQLPHAHRAAAKRDDAPTARGALRRQRRDPG